MIAAPTPGRKPSAMKLGGRERARVREEVHENGNREGNTLRKLHSPKKTMAWVLHSEEKVKLRRGMRERNSRKPKGERSDRSAKKLTAKKIEPNESGQQKGGLFRVLLLPKGGLKEKGRRTRPTGVHQEPKIVLRDKC